MIPNKSNFKFQELTPITGVKPYVLRFWEVEFEEINPITSDSGQKLYDKKDIEAILKIKKLLFDEKRSIAEARAILSSNDFTEVTVEAADNHLLHMELVRNCLVSSIDLIAEIKSKQNW